MPLRVVASALVFLTSVEMSKARLGSPSNSEDAMPQQWSQSVNETLSRQLSEGDVRAMSMHGFNYYASTTVYGDTPMSACGSLNTAELVRGTEYYAVASAQAMQSVYEPSTGGCSWECHDMWGQLVDQCHYEHPEGSLLHSKPIQGCWCKQVGACWCGKASPQAGMNSGTAPMGCFQCGRGHFLKRHPYELHMMDGHELVGQEIKVVVADACPYGPNSQWCPGQVGDGNALGVQNHLDFATAPPFPEEEFKNNFFVFTPEPCSLELQQRMLGAAQKCPANTWPQDDDNDQPSSNDEGAR
mmetsp:Transcript_49751/g.105952  ORF Transcript_49751/g.105952 Transcript_49751/m.105952 type:complete len:299 (-) Transcript_49751:687-1583(-)